MFEPIASLVTGIASPCETLSDGVAWTVFLTSLSSVTTTHRPWAFRFLNSRGVGGVGGVSTFTPRDVSKSSNTWSGPCPKAEMLRQKHTAAIECELFIGRSG